MTTQNTNTPPVIGETPKNPLNSKEVCHSETAESERQQDLSVQDEGQITPEIVRSLLKEITEGAWIGGTPLVHTYIRVHHPNKEADARLIAAAPSIAKAYLVKSRRVEVLETAFAACRQDNVDLSNEKKTLRESIKIKIEDQLNLREKNASLQDIINKQREALSSIINTIGNGDGPRDELGRIENVAEEALALTTQEKQG